MMQLLNGCRELSAWFARSWECNTLRPCMYDRRPAATLGALPLATKPPPAFAASNKTAGSPSLATPIAIAVISLGPSGCNKPHDSCMPVIDWNFWYGNKKSIFCQHMCDQALDCWLPSQASSWRWCCKLNSQSPYKIINGKYGLLFRMTKAVAAVCYTPRHQETVLEGCTICVLKVACTLVMVSHCMLHTWIHAATWSSSFALTQWLTSRMYIEIVPYAQRLADWSLPFTAQQWLRILLNVLGILA